MNYISQIDVGTISPGVGIIPGDDPGLTFADILSTAIGVMTIIAGIWFLFSIITGGIAIIGSDGDAQKVADAKARITNGLIGIVVVIAAFFIIGGVSLLFGLEYPLNISGFLNRY